ncbi:MAG: pyrroline-5-carboxylate reductase [Candidatus Omnitrophota bacterium]
MSGTKKIAIIGGGNMGEAIFRGVRRKFTVFICEADQSRARHLERVFRIKTKDLEEAVRQSSVIILAVKPQNMDDVLRDIKRMITKEQLVISIAAGITASYLEKGLGPGRKIIRTMPNMPARIGEGVTAVCRGKNAGKNDVALAVKIFNQLGETVVVEENFLDAVTAVSGSGPAYVFLFIECLLKAARALGLNQTLSRKLVYATLLGSAHLLVQQKADAAELRAKVTSKGGTTQAAMDVFMRCRIERIFREALQAAKKRAGELSRKS